MTDLIIAVAAIAVVVFFSKQILGFGLSFRKKLENRVPLTSKIERGLKDLKRKREDLGFTLKDLYKAQEITKQQLATADEQGKDSRVENLKKVQSKIDGKIEEVKSIIKRINSSSDELKSQLSYVEAMRQIGDIKDLDIDASVDDLLAEIKAVEMMLEEM